MSSFVRSSKYRHVFGQPAKNEKCFTTMKIASLAGDSNGCAASSKTVAVCWQSGGGGAFAVVDQNDPGRYSNPTLFNGHRSGVLDLAYNPFNDSLIASASDDCTVKLWAIPEELKRNETVNDSLQTLEGHRKKVNGIRFNPVASNVIASFSADRTLQIWDVESGASKVTCDVFGDLIQGCDWSINGDQIVTTCKDKKIRIIDARTGEVAMEGDNFPGAKGSNIVWMKRKNKFFLCGFTRSAERAYRILDPRNLGEALHEKEIDNSNGAMMPFFDEDTNVLFLAGKGDGNIRYYEMVDDKPYCHYLNEYKSSAPQKGMCALPKLAVNVQGCEIQRLFKTTKDKIEPISMVVPRKTDAFADDIYPDSWLNEAALSAEEFFAGKQAERKTISMEEIYKGAFSVGGGSASGFTKKASPLEEAKEEAAALKKENEELKKRVADLEAELAKLKA